MGVEWPGQLIIVSLLTLSFCQQQLHTTTPTRITIFCSPFRYRMRSSLLSEICLSVGTARSTAILPWHPLVLPHHASRPPSFDRVRYHHFQLFRKIFHQLVDDSTMSLLVKRPHVRLTAGHDVTYGLSLLLAQPAGRAYVYT